jgi:hypothetical protein
VIVAIDLDGTLAEYNTWEGVYHIGPPVEKMVDIILKHISDGDTCIIFTSRLSDEVEAPTVRHVIRAWLKQWNLPYMESTAIKRKEFKIFYDDRARRIAQNQGVRI